MNAAPHLKISAGLRGLLTARMLLLRDRAALERTERYPCGDGNCKVPAHIARELRQYDAAIASNTAVIEVCEQAAKMGVANQ